MPKLRGENLDQTLPDFSHSSRSSEATLVGNILHFIKIFLVSLS